MITVIIKRNDEPTVIQMTQENIIRDLKMVNGSEMLLTDTWAQGLNQVRTPYVCLVEADCVLSSNYFSSNFGLMHKSDHKVPGQRGGYNKLAMISSCVGYKAFDNRIYNYRLKNIKQDGEGLIDGKNWSLKSWHIKADREKRSSNLYSAQVGFVPGAVIRVSSLNGTAGKINWDDRDLVRLSTEFSFHLWSTGRRIQINPNTTYVSNDDNLPDPKLFKFKVPDAAGGVFTQEGI
jgi:hypothetical protein